MHYRHPRPPTSYDSFKRRGPGQVPTGPLALYAIVIATEAQPLLRKARFEVLPVLKPAQLHPSTPDLDTPLALCALLGPAVAAEASTVLRHDRVVTAAHRRTSGVVPFRFGATVPDLLTLDDLLRVHQAPLWRVLTRMRNRVEVGLKLRPLGDTLPERLAPIRALAPTPQRRREHLGHDSSGRLFTGAYLITRSDLKRFWVALEELRHEIVGQPLIGSGPHAPYSFCDVALLPGSAGMPPRLRFAEADQDPPAPVLAPPSAAAGDAP